MNELMEELRREIECEARLMFELDKSAALPFATGPLPGFDAQAEPIKDAYRSFVARGKGYQWPLKSHDANPVPVHEAVFQALAVGRRAA